MKKHEAVRHYGGVVQLAVALGIKPQSVSQWGETIPQGRAYQIELMTGGKLKAEPATPSGQQRPYQRVAAGTPPDQLSSVKRAMAPIKAQPGKA